MKESKTQPNHVAGLKTSNETKVKRTFDTATGFHSASSSNQWIGLLFVMLLLLGSSTLLVAQANRYFDPFQGEPVMEALPTSYQEFLDETLDKAYHKGITSELATLVIITQGASPVNLGNLKYAEPVTIWFQGKVVQGYDGGAEFTDPQSSIRAVVMALRQVSEDNGLGGLTRNDATMIQLLFGKGGELESAASRAQQTWEKTGQKWPIQTEMAVGRSDSRTPKEQTVSAQQTSHSSKIDQSAQMEIPKGTVLVSIDDLTELKERAERPGSDGSRTPESNPSQPHDMIVNTVSDTLSDKLVATPKIKGRPVAQFVIGGDYGYLQRLITEDVIHERKDTVPMQQYGGHVGLRFNVFPKSPVGLMIQARCGIGYRNAEGIGEGYYANVTGDLGLKLWFVTVYGGLTRQYNSMNHSSRVIEKTYTKTSTHLGLQINPSRRFGLWVQVSNPEHLYQQKRLDQGIYLIGASLYL